MRENTSMGTTDRRFIRQEKEDGKEKNGATILGSVLFLISALLWVGIVLSGAV